MAGSRRLKHTVCDQIWAKFKVFLGVSRQQSWLIVLSYCNKHATSSRTSSTFPKNYNRWRKREIIATDVFWKPRFRAKNDIWWGGMSDPFECVKFGEDAAKLCWEQWLRVDISLRAVRNCRLSFGLALLCFFYANYFIRGRIIPVNSAAHVEFVKARGKAFIWFPFCFREVAQFLSRKLHYWRKIFFQPNFKWFQVLQLARIT